LSGRLDDQTRDGEEGREGRKEKGTWGHAWGRYMKKVTLFHIHAWGLKCDLSCCGVEDLLTCGRWEPSVKVAEAAVADTKGKD
jgi:hypothetical protein